MYDCGNKLHIYLICVDLIIIYKFKYFTQKLTLIIRLLKLYVNITTDHVNIYKICFCTSNIISFVSMIKFRNVANVYKQLHKTIFKLFRDMYEHINLLSAKLKSYHFQNSCIHVVWFWQV